MLSLMILLALQFHGLAQIRLDSGQTWYASAEVSADSPYQGEMFWIIRTTPEHDFLNRDIDALAGKSSDKQVRIEITQDGVLWVWIPEWGRLIITPHSLEDRQALQELQVNPLRIRHVRVIDYPDRGLGEVTICIAHPIWGPIW